MRLIKGECLETMAQLAAHSIDMIFTDLPYGTTRNKWDVKIPLDKLWEQFLRLIKDDGAIVLFAQTPFDKILGASQLKLLKYEWIWVKRQGSGHLNAKKMPLKRHENLLVFYKKLPTYNPQMTEGKPYISKSSSKSSNYDKQRTVVTINDGVRYPSSILEFKSDKGLHPTQKPVALCEYLIKTYTNAGDTVLDCCMGSGTTGVACMNTGREFIGIESSEKYFTTACQRLGIKAEEAL